MALVIAPVLLRPVVAHACSCAVGLDLALPVDGSEGVPTNTKIWLDGFLECVGGAPMAWRLLDPDGVEVAYRSRCVLSHNIADALLTLHPVEPLRPDTMYVVEEGEGNPVLRFTTGALPDLESPSLPVEIDREVEHTRPNSCSDQRTHQATLTLEGDGALFVLDAGDAGALDVAAIAGEVVEMSGEPRLRLGSSLCHGDNFPGGASRRAETAIRYGAFDLAGNFSGWTEPDALSLGGCSVAAGQVAPGWLLLLMLLGRGRGRGAALYRCRGGVAAAHDRAQRGP